MSIPAYTINELCELFQMSRQYLYRLIKEGKGPLLSGDDKHPTIKLWDALVFGEERERATSQSYRDRWQAGIRRIRIDMKLAQLSQDKADAALRAQHKQEKLAAYERELDAWERARERNPLLRKARPAHPFERQRERAKGHADWLPVQNIPSRLV
jgi:hypothetical protein